MLVWLAANAVAASLVASEPAPFTLDHVAAKDVVADDDGRTWFATASGILVRSPDGAWRVLAVELPAPALRLHATPGAVWIETEAGVVGVGPDGGRLPGPEGADAARRPAGLGVAGDGTVWVSFLGGGLYARSPDGQWRRDPRPIELRAFATDRQGGLRAAGPAGSYALPADADTWVPAGPARTWSSTPLGLAADGAVWTPSGGHGVTRVSPTGQHEHLRGARVEGVTQAGGTVWILGRGRAWSVERSRPVHHRLPGAFRAALGHDVWADEAGNAWLATSMGVVVLPADDAAPRAVLELGLLSREPRLAPYPGRPDAAWVATNEGAYAVDAVGRILERHALRPWLPLRADTRLRAAPDGTLWSAGPAVGPVDPARGAVQVHLVADGEPAFGTDGAAWVGDGRELTRVDRVSGTAHTVLVPGREAAVDARDDRVRVVTPTSAFVVWDYHLRRETWSPVVVLPAAVRAALREVEGNPVRDARGGTWWPTTGGLVGDGGAGRWRWLPLPPAAEGLRDVAVAGGEVYVAAGRGLWRVDDDELLPVTPPETTGAVEIAGCGDTLWVAGGDRLYALRPGAPPAALALDARPLGCSDGALWVSRGRLGRVEEDGAVRWGSGPARSGPRRVNALVAPGPDPAPADTVWARTDAGFELLDLRTGARAPLGPGAAGAHHATVGVDGALWYASEGAVARWDLDGPTAWFTPWSRRAGDVAELQVLADGGVLARPEEGGSWVAASDGGAFAPAARPEPWMFGRRHEEAGATWSTGNNGLWRQDADGWTRVLRGPVQVVAPGHEGTWVGAVWEEPALVRIVGAEVVERADHAPPGSAYAVLQARDGRLWVGGSNGVALRGLDGAWTRGESPWQNGKGDPCPFPVEAQRAGGWVPTVRVPRAAPLAVTEDDAGHVRFTLDKNRYRIRAGDWPGLRDQWLHPGPYAPEAPWGATIGWIWEEPAGGLRFVTRFAGAAGETPAVYALDGGAWRRLTWPAKTGTSFTHVVPRPGGGAAFLLSSGELFLIDADGTRRDLDAPPDGALDATPDGVVVGSSIAAAARVGDAWRGIASWRAPAVAMDTDVLLTRDGRLVELAEEPRVWTAPVAWAADVVTLGGRRCVVGEGVRCLDAAGGWTGWGADGARPVRGEAAGSLAEGHRGALLDAAVDGDTLWVTGLTGPDGTRGGVACHARSDTPWRCAALPALGRSVTPDGGGGAWVGTTAGLVHVKGDGRVAPTRFVAPITRVARGATTLWIGTDTDGLWAWDPATDSGARLLAGRVRALDAEGPRAWAWTDQGIHELHE